MANIKVYIIDEHISVRSALAERLGRSSKFQVIGHGGEVQQILKDIEIGKPNLILLEVKRKDGMGLELLRQLSRLETAPHLAVLTSYSSDWEERAAMRAGAERYLLKNIDSEDLIATTTAMFES